MERSPLTYVFLLLFVITLVSRIWIIAIKVGQLLGLLSSPGDEDLEPLFRATVGDAKGQSDTRRKRTKGKKREGSGANNTGTQKTPEARAKAVEPPPPRQPGTSLKALKRQSANAKSSPASHHSSSLYVGTLVHTDEVTGVAFSDDRTVVTSCRDRALRRFQLGTHESSKNQTITAIQSHLISKGVSDVCCVGGSVVYLTRGAGGEPALASARLDEFDNVVNMCERVFAPKSNCEPLKLVGAGSTAVAASSSPRVAVFNVAADGRLSSSSASGASYDTSSMLNHDIAISPDGSKFVVATFSADLPIFTVQRSKLNKLASCTGAKKKVRSVAWSPCSQYIAAASEDMMLRVFDVRAGSKAQFAAKATAGVPSSGPLTSLCWVDGKVIGASDRDIFVFDGDSLRVEHAIYEAHGSGGISLAASNKQKCKFFTSRSSGSLRLWKLE